jgi:hypothetical protein
VAKLNDTIDKNRQEYIKGIFDIQKEVFHKISMQKSDAIIQFQKMQEAMGLNTANLSPKINLNSLNKVMEMILQHLMVKNQIQFWGDDEEVLVSDESPNGSSFLKGMTDDPHIVETKGQRFFTKERLMLQSKKVIETAWLVFQEINLV